MVGGQETLPARAQLGVPLGIGKPEKHDRNGEFDCGEDVLKPMRPPVADQRDQPPDAAGEHDARQQAHIVGAGRGFAGCAYPAMPYPANIAE